MTQDLTPANGVSKSIFNSWRQVQQASAELFRFEKILDELSYRIQKEMKFDFAAIQLIRRDEKIIETVHGTGVAREWTGKAKHYMDELEDLSDIQTIIAVANPPRAETIAGWDDRFDEWIYDTYNHEELVRLFAPFILARDKNYRVIDEWWKSVQWGYGDEIEIKGKRRNATGKVRVYKLKMPEESSDFERPDFEIIGTVEVGYTDPKKKIDPDQSTDLLNLISMWTLELQKALLPYVLERIVGNAIEIVKGDSASLHFQEIPKESRYVYEVRAGDIPRDFLNNFPPREGKMGKSAIEKKQVIIIPDPSKGQDEAYLKEYNPGIYDFGIRSIAAFPLIVDKTNKGVLYIHFHQPHPFSDSEIEPIKLYANQVCAVIRNTTIYMQRRDRARQMETLHSIVQSLVSVQSLSSSPAQEGLLSKIAWNTLNMTGSDIVTIYEYAENEYIQIDQRFKTPPAAAGRFIDNSKMRTKLYQGDAPVLLVNSRKDVYEESFSQENIFLNRPRHKRDKLRFVEREQIKSTAGVLLKVGDEIVGVMFINYRRQHTFADEEKEIIQTLSSSAAIAIHNRRQFEKTQGSLTAINHQLKYPLISILNALSHDFMGELSENANHQVEKAIAWTLTAYALCNGSVLSFAREAGLDPDVDLEDMDVHVEINHLRELFQLTTHPDELEFPLYINPNFPKVKMDREIFTSVMYSLIHNATKYADEKSEITIKCLTGSNNFISIKSSGEPILDHEKEQIFEKFRRGEVVENTGRHHSGVGLGLWVARELMRSIGGDIEVQTFAEDDRTSEFVVTLPI